MTNVNSFAKATKNMKLVSATAEISAKNQKVPVNLVAQLEEYGAKFKGSK